MSERNYHSHIHRRNFLKWGMAGFLSLPLVTKAKLTFGRSFSCWPINYWEGPEGEEYCVHHTVYDGEVEQGYIWARIDGWWKRFQIRALEETFWNWNFEERIASFEEQLADEPYEFRAGGPHSPSVATYGNVRGRGDSDFHLNNKIIGINCVADADHIKDINDTMLDMIKAGASQKEKVAWLKDIHEQDIWRRDVQVGIELFSDPTWQTHTFLNLMENPVATLCFQGRSGMNVFKSFELRCIAHIVHPRDPKVVANEVLYQTAIFPSVLHGFYHSFYPDEINEPAVLYYSVEEFDNSVTAKGKRLVRNLTQKIKNYFT